MNLLLSGGCGFVGTAICRRFLASRPGLRITVIDSLRRRGAESNVAVLESLGVKVVHGDIRLPQDLNVDHFNWIIDAAAEPSVTGGGTTREQMVGHNLAGTLNLIELAASQGAGFILLSTSRVYSIEALKALPLNVRDDAFCLGARPFPPFWGISDDGVAEDFSTESPLSLYGATKLASEIMAMEYGKQTGTPVVINRCGMLAGAGQFGRPDQGVFSWWIRQWAARGPLAYRGFGGVGHQVRDVLHPFDLADLILKQIDAAPQEVVNVSGGIESATSLAQLSSVCRDALGPHEVSSDPDTHAYDVPWLVLDSSEARRRYDWRPTITRGEIFKEIIESC